MWNLEISCKSKIKLLQILIPSDVLGKHYSNDIKGWLLRFQNLEYFIVLFYFMESIVFVVYLNKLQFLSLKLSVI